MSFATCKRLEVTDINENDIVIAVTGLTGVGKSTFINSAIEEDILDVNHGFTRATTIVQHVACSNPKCYGNRRVVFVETPGFDSERDGGAIRETLKVWLNQISRQNVKISGILYLHRITDIELWLTPPAHHLDLFQALCKDSVGVFPSRMMMVTTMWDIIKSKQSSEAFLREAEIQRYWDRLSKGGAPSKVQRFKKTFNCASSIVLTLLGDEESEWLEKEVELRDEHAEERRPWCIEEGRSERERAWLDRLEHEERESLDCRRREWLGREKGWLERLGREERERVDQEREWIRLLEQDEWARLEREERGHRERLERERLKRERIWLEKLEDEERRRLQRERERLERLGREEMERLERKKKQAEDEERKQLKRLCFSRLSELMPHHHGFSLKLKKALKNLPGDESQLMVNFLDQVLTDEHALDLGKRLLYSFAEIVKLTRGFPQRFNLTRAPCDFTAEPTVSGAFSNIYLGRLHDRPEICVKAVRLHSSEVSRDGILKAHAGVFALSAHTSHPNVLPILGVYRTTDVAFSGLCIVFPWAVGGNLAGYLRNNPKTPRIPLLMDAISGLSYIHQRGIIHCDLNAKNILVSATGHAMLSLSTISRVKGFHTATLDHPGTVNWMAPELLTADTLPHYAEASDIWAFGCTCYEVMTDKTPFEEYTDALQLIPAFLQHKIDPSKLKPTPDAAGVWELMGKCMNLVPEHRPSAEEAKSFLTRLNVDDSRPVSASGSHPDFMRHRSSLPEINYHHLHTVLLSLLRIKQLADASVFRPLS